MNASSHECHGKRKSQERDWECRERGRIAVLNRVVRNSFTKRVTLAHDLKEVRKAVWLSGGRGLHKAEQPALRPKAGIYWGCGRNIKKGDLAGAE